jgi:hypothetical protein
MLKNVRDLIMRNITTSVAMANIAANAKPAALEGTYCQI